jgi:ribose transport system substrate-binding protein
MIATIRARLLLTGAAAAASLVAAGCSSGSSSTTAATSAANAGAANAGAAKKGGLIAYVPPISGSAFFETISCGVKTAVTAAGYKFTTQAPPKFDAGLQTQIIQALQQRSPAAMVVDVVATQQLAPVLTSLTKRTAIVTSLEPIDVPGQVGSVLFDQKNFGVIQAQQLVKKMGEKGQVFLMDYQSGSQTLDERAQGVQAELAKHPGIKIVGHEYAVGDPTKAAQQTAAIMQRFPKLSGIVATDVYSTTGVINAVKAAKARDRIAIVSADLVPDTLRELKAGDIDAFVATKNFALGKASGQAAVDALAGKQNKIPDYVADAQLAITEENVAVADSDEYANKTC